MLATSTNSESIMQLPTKSTNDFVVEAENLSRYTNSESIMQISTKLVKDHVIEAENLRRSTNSESNMLIPTTTIKDYVLEEVDSDSDVNFNRNEIGHLKELCRTIDLSPDITRLIVDHSQEELVKKTFELVKYNQATIKDLSVRRRLILRFSRFLQGQYIS